MKSLVRLCVLLSVLTACFTSAAQSVLVPSGATWKWNTGVNLGTAWRATDYNDTTWEAGPAELGYGDGGEATVIPRTSPVNPCYYFRHAFTGGDPSLYSTLSLEVFRDDGCVVYLNGQEVARYNMPSDTIVYDTWASVAIEPTWDPPLSIPNLLVPGNNVIAVELHQANATSTDISLDLKLTATIDINVALNSPAAGAAGVPQPATLTATATSPAGQNLNVSFYGRPAPAHLPDFTLAMLPDTQNYTAHINGGLNEMFVAQTDWIVANRDAWNIVYVAQMGDISQNGDANLNESEWINAEAALSRLEPALPPFPNGLPYGAAVGNHDQTVPASDTDPTTFYNKYFGPSRFSSRSYYGGSFDTLKNNNQYQLFSASGFDFIVVYLEYAPSSAALSWADGVLKTCSNRRAIVVSHSLLELTGAWSAPGLQIYDALKNNPNLFLMLCGHNHGEVRRTDVYNGNTVQTVLADYQNYAGGGSGYLRLLTFSPDNNEIRVTTYSPYLNQSETDANSQFTLPWSANTGSAFTLVQANTAVPSGTSTSATWNSLQPGATYEWYVTATEGTATAASEVRQFTVAANNPPTVTLTSPAEGSLFASGESITVSATADDTDGAIASVEFFDGTISLGTSASSPYTTTITVSAGNHTFTAVATDDGGAKTTSSPVHVFVGSAPMAPSGLVPTPMSPTRIDLTWVDNSDNETGFEVQVFLDGSVYSVQPALPANITSASITGLKPATAYSFIVRAFNPVGSSASSEAFASTPALPDPPTAPSGLTAVPASATSIQLAWTDTSATETGFTIERSLDGSAWAPVQTTPADTTAWLDTSLSSGTVYHYRVSAFNDGGSATSGTAAAAPFIDAYATGETTTLGTLTGSRNDTLALDSAFEILTEKIAGRKTSRYNSLDHSWTFNVTPGNSVVFWVNAYQTPSADNDDFALSWSTDNATYQPMVTVTATSDLGAAGYQSFALPNTLQGLVYVRVRDTDQTLGATSLDSLYVNHLLIRTDVSPLTSAPAAPVLQSAVPGDGTVTLTWAAATGAATYNVWRMAPGETVNTRIASGLTDTTYTDTGLANGTEYQYVVTAVNAYDESKPSNMLSCTPQAPSTVTVEPPATLRASAAKAKINLSWIQSLTPGVTQNNIYRSTDGTTFNLLATIPAGTTYSDRAASGTHYYYYVTAVIDSTESAASNITDATAK